MNVFIFCLLFCPLFVSVMSSSLHVQPPNPFEVCDNDVLTHTMNPDGVRGTQLGAQVFSFGRLTVLPASEIWKAIYHLCQTGH